MAQQLRFEPGQLGHYTFQLPAVSCVVSGRVVGISGGGKDFEAFINGRRQLQELERWSPSARLLAIGARRRYEHRERRC